jgi:leucyl aminopeptidase (aminopeptidase T)
MSDLSKAPIMPDARLKTVRHLLANCGSLKPRERLLILCDETTADFAALFHKEAKRIAPGAELLQLPVGRMHGQEPPEDAARRMLDVDLIISLCQFSLAHTTARINAGKRSARFLSMPCYSWELLDNPALMVDYQKQAPIVRRVSELFSRAARVRVRTRAGTDIVLSAEGRAGNCCPGFVEKAGDLGSPPDIEANVSPVEDRSEGTVVVDGSITCPELGLLTTPVVLTVKNGRITRFESRNPEYVRILDQMFEDPGSKRRVLAECGVGLNPNAQLTGTMLTDEGALGCIHFGFGSNFTVGGLNRVDFHLDFVFRQGTLEIDDLLVMQDGKLMI